jgi:hypothetical protein
MKLIPLTKGAFAAVDDEDYALLSRFKWRLAKGKGSSYAQTQLKRRTIKMHRLILGGQHVDHRDGNGLNNQKHNLRPATPTQNSWNRKAQKHSSKYKGVHFMKANRKWMASIRLEGKKKHLGYFENEFDAAMAYDAAAAANFGNFARTNKMEGLLN